jgi:hypothetical protein
VQADYCVELGREDPALELPWSSENHRYYDLKRNPEWVHEIREAADFLELRTFLTRINAKGFPLQTAKCDTWYTRDLSPEEEETFGAAGKFGSYVDLVFAETEPESAERAGVPRAETMSRRLSLEAHETLSKNLCALLKRAPEIAATIELVIRHCYYHLESNPATSESGFCITTYVSGFGENEAEARQRWSIALTLVQNALVQAVRSN